MTPQFIKVTEDTLCPIDLYIISDRINILYKYVIAGLSQQRAVPLH